MKEELSAFLDGDVDASTCDPVFESLRRSPDLRERWDAYCLIGDALRGDGCDRSDLVARVMQGLDAEPTVLAPAKSRVAHPNRLFGGAMMPIAASVMGVIAVGIVAFTLYPSAPDSTPLPGVIAAQATAQTVAQVSRQPAEVLSEAGEAHREYMFVHQAMSGGGPIPGVVHYVRTVSEIRGDPR